MESILGGLFIHIDLSTALQVVLLGFIGGILSGFIGSGGAFFMTPGMMNLGVQGVVAVASNITHKFGKAMVGSHSHGKMGNVDKKLAIFMLGTAAVGIRLAVWINSLLFSEGEGASKGAGSNLYISLVFVTILVVVAISMLRDLASSKGGEEGGADGGPSRKIVDALSRVYLPPVIHFKVADVKVSLWIIMIVGLATGYLAGTIGVGGFIGVPAMIYVFGIPTAVAAGTELYLAMFMGAFGALNYAWAGFVDLRLALLLYLGSLVGVHLGTYGVKVVNEKYIRMVTGLIILLCVLSRAIAIPMYLRQLDLVSLNPDWDAYFQGGSKVLLFASGIAGAGLILLQVAKAYRQRRRIKDTMEAGRVSQASEGVVKHVSAA